MSNIFFLIIYSNSKESVSLELDSYLNFNEHGGIEVTCTSHSYWLRLWTFLAGFTTASKACCGNGGQFAGIIPCGPTSSMCSDRNKHVFWDPYHPSEASNLIIAKQLINGNTRVISPMNLRQLRDYWFSFSWNTSCLPVCTISFELYPVSCLKYCSLIKYMFLRFFI